MRDCGVRRKRKRHPVSWRLHWQTRPVDEPLASPVMVSRSRFPCIPHNQGGAFRGVFGGQPRAEQGAATNRRSGGVYLCIHKFIDRDSMSHLERSMR